ncbi:MAG: amidohydrolase [Oscillospiraceae bacterium]|jgi:5-methylthioadenosine/S-adenosylhomocysteine deaminase|nr:amidohydrolase [Oscillospiraceae bacterium]
MRTVFSQAKALLPAGITDADVVTEDGRIAEILPAGTAQACESTISAADKLLLPGFVNAHTHAYMTLLRGRGDDLPFMDWLFGRILPMEDKLTPEDAYWGTQLALLEMLRTGTTCYNDMYIHAAANGQAAKDAGMRAVLSKGLVGDAADDPGGLERLQTATDEMRLFADCDRLSFRLAPHAPYTCAPGYLQTVAAAAKELGVGIHTHLCESKAEIAQIREKYNCTPFEMFAESGIFDSPTVAAHCVYMTESDMDIAVQHGVAVASNPVSNLKLGNGIAPIARMLEKGIIVSLGTDGAASNNALNMIRELGYLALLQKGVTGQPEVLPAAKAIEIATIGGAAALGMADRIGSIEVGKAADLTLIDLSDAHMQPAGNIPASLAYAAGGSEVVCSMVGGRVLYQDGDYKTLDEQRIRYECQVIAERFRNG